MKKSTTEEICKYLFQDRQMSFFVRKQDSYKMVKYKDKARRFILFKKLVIDKDLFLIYLDVLFGLSGEGGLISQCHQSGWQSL